MFSDEAIGGSKNFKDGFRSGYEQAGQDIVNKCVVDLAGFDFVRTTGSHYEMGFELGYYRKLAEMFSGGKNKGNEGFRLYRGQ